MATERSRGKQVSVDVYGFGPALIGCVWIRTSADWLNNIFWNKIDKKDSKIDFKMSVIVVESIRGRCASFMILAATVSDICGGQTNVSILVV